MSLLTKEYLISKGFIEKSYFFMHNLFKITFNCPGKNHTLITIVVCFRLRSIDVLSAYKPSDKDIAFESNIVAIKDDFTEERLEAILNAFSPQPIPIKKTPSRISPLASFVGGLVVAWEASKYQEVKICTNCLSQSNKGECCSNPNLISLDEYLKKCKSFSARYAELKRQYNELLIRFKDKL